MRFVARLLSGLRPRPDARPSEPGRWRVTRRDGKVEVFDFDGIDFSTWADGTVDCAVRRGDRWRRVF